MTDPIQPDLLGYLLDALDADERQRVEEQLERDPALHDDLTRLRGALDVLDDGERHADPPADLARRTCQFIFQHDSRPHDAAAEGADHRTAVPRGVGAPVSLGASAAAESLSVPSRGGRRRPARLDEPLGVPNRSWRFVDLAVAVAICVAGVALVFPLINVSRANARLAACANNLRQIGIALTQYSDHHNGFFPRVEETGKLGAGGIYAPILLTGGYLNNPRMFVCPSSELADDASFRVPSLDELRSANGTALDNLRRDMGGSYGYALGYREQGVYKPTRNLYREAFALAANAPEANCLVSLNHCRTGHNVLLEDGHVIYLRDSRMQGTTDDIFRNDEGRVAAGCHVNDAVVARSEATP